jgi:PKD repeat protein
MTASNVWIAYHDPNLTCGLTGQGACPTGVPITFGNGTSFYDFSCATHTFSWQFDDGTMATGWTADHTYTTVGPHTVNLTISNPSQTITLSQVVNTQACIPPFGARIGISAPFIPGQYRMQVIPMSGTNLTYTWYAGTTVIGGGSQFMTVSPAVTTTYFCRLSNTCGTYDTDPVTITIAAGGCPVMQPNVTVFPAFHGPVSGCTQISGYCYPNEDIAFDARAFGYDFNCATHAFTWNFGDSTMASGASVTHRYTAPVQTFTVSLTISNPQQTVVATTPLMVNGEGFPPTPTPPVPMPPPPACGQVRLSPANANAEVGVPFRLTLIPSGGTPPYAIFPIGGALPRGLDFLVDTISGTPAAAGVYSVSDHVVDSRGCGTVTSLTITVAGREVPCPLMVPYLNVAVGFHGQTSGCTELGETACRAGETIDFTPATFGYSFECQPHTFAWNLGDGQLAGGKNVSRAYAQNGTYTVTLTITNAEQTVQMTKTIAVGTRHRASHR